MLKHKIVSVFLVVLLLSTFAFTGCGKPGATDQNQSTTEESQASSISSKTENSGEMLPTKDSSLDKSAVLDFTFWGSTYEKQVIETVFNEFEKKVGVKVNPIHIPGDNAAYETKITTMMAANDPPDAGYLIAATSYKWFKEGKLYNMNELFTSDPSFVKDDYIPSALLSLDDKTTIGLTSAVETFAIAYNRDMFKQAGLPDPPSTAETAWSWDQFLDAASKLTLDNSGNNALQGSFDPKNVKQYGVFYPLWFGPIDALLARNGVRYLTDDGKEFNLNKPEGLEVLQKISDLMNVQHVSPSPTSQKSLPAPSISLQSKKYAMAVIGQWELNDLGKTNGLNFGLTPLPVMKNTVQTHISGLTVAFQGTKYPKETWEAIKFMSDPSACLTIYKDGLWMPTMKSWYTDPEKLAQWATGPAHPKEYKTVFVDPVLEDTIPCPELCVNNFSEINNNLFASLDLLWNNKMDAAEALKDAEPKIKPLINGYFK